MQIGDDRANRFKCHTIGYAAMVPREYLNECMVLARDIDSEVTNAFARWGASQNLVVNVR